MSIKLDRRSNSSVVQHARLSRQRPGVPVPLRKRLVEIVSRPSTLKALFLVSGCGVSLTFEGTYERTTEDDKLLAATTPQCPYRPSICGTAMRISICSFLCYPHGGFLAPHEEQERELAAATQEVAAEINEEPAPVFDVYFATHSRFLTLQPFHSLCCCVSPTKYICCSGCSLCCSRIQFLSQQPQLVLQRPQLVLQQP